MAKQNLEQEKIYVEQKLSEKNLTYLNVTIRGNNIVIYSEYEKEKEKENRCRFTKVGSRSYIMNMANRTGKWETTPFEGSLPEMVEMVIEQFPWVLIDYSIEGMI
jgi:hypothetical protein